MERDPMDRASSILPSKSLFHTHLFTHQPTSFIHRVCVKTHPHSPLCNVLVHMHGGFVFASAFSIRSYSFHSFVAESLIRFAHASMRLLTSFMQTFVRKQHSCFLPHLCTSDARE